MVGPYVGAEVTRDSPVGIAPPCYTRDELALLREAESVILRAWEAGHFTDLIVEEWTGREKRPTFRSLILAAERAQFLVPSGVRVEARGTAIGDKLLVRIEDKS